MTQSNNQSNPLPYESAHINIAETHYKKPGGECAIIARAYMYLASIPRIKLIRGTVRVGWQVLSFLITVGNRKQVIQQQKAGETQVTSIAQEQLPVTADSRQAREMQIHFLEMASHELKTPMTAILGQAQLLLRRLSRMPELTADMLNMRTALLSIDSQTRRLSELVDDLLDLYNIRAGKIQLRLSRFDIVEMCREVVAEQHLLSGRMIKFVARRKPVLLYADSDRLRQVVVNLLSNAIAYSPEGSQVKVLVDRYGDIGSIEVHDQGPGIPVDQQTHIFEPFYRGSNAQSNAKSGRGLGLAICRDIVERHVGRIWCRSREGKGSIFIIELPVNKQMGEVAPAFIT